jgi:hypothetical protein
MSVASQARRRWLLHALDILVFERSSLRALAIVPVFPLPHSVAQDSSKRRGGRNLVWGDCIHRATIEEGMEGRAIQEILRLRSFLRHQLDILCLRIKHAPALGLKSHE